MSPKTVSLFFYKTNRKTIDKIKTVFHLCSIQMSYVPSSDTWWYSL